MQILILYFALICGLQRMKLIVAVSSDTLAKASSSPRGLITVQRLAWLTVAPSGAQLIIN